MNSILKRFSKTCVIPKDDILKEIKEAKKQDNKFKNMTYKQGVINTLEWIIGLSYKKPISDFNDYSEVTEINTYNINLLINILKDNHVSCISIEDCLISLFNSINYSLIPLNDDHKTLNIDTAIYLLFNIEPDNPIVEFLFSYKWATYNGKLSVLNLIIRLKYVLIHKGCPVNWKL